ncbi:glycoside hydrolase family 18 protein [Poronia punctata]|nr:glycoside hydrolase family 18 protein [Poronia punctata]
MESDNTRCSLINAVYYPSWRVYHGFPPSSLQIERIDRVCYAFLRLNTDGTLRPLDKHADDVIEVDGERGCLAALGRLKEHYPRLARKKKRNGGDDEGDEGDEGGEKQPRLQTMVSIGGGGGSTEFPEMALDPIRRATFAAACRAFVDAHGLDGVDIDWEHPSTPEQGANFIALLTALRAALPATRYLLSTSLPIDLSCLRNISVPKAGQLLDNINLMGYDFSGPWTNVAGNQAQLYTHGANTHARPSTSVQQGVGFLTAQGFPPRKILLGIPAYARVFYGAEAPGQSYHGVAEVEYKDIPAHYIRDARVDYILGAASYVGRLGHFQGPEHTTRDGAEHGFFSFDVPETVRLKAEYVKQQGLGGLFYWHGVGDLASGKESLVYTGWESLNNKMELS